MQSRDPPNTHIHLTRFPPSADRLSLVACPDRVSTCSFAPSSSPQVVQEVLMDILRALSSPNVDICKKTLNVAMDLVSVRNIEEVVQVLKREVVRTQVRRPPPNHGT